MRSRARILSIVLVLLLGVIASCGSDDSGASGDPVDGSIPGAGREPNDPLTWTPARTDCSNPAYPQPVPVTASSAQGSDYLRGIVACVSGPQARSVWLNNVGDEVWRLDGGGRGHRWLDWNLETVLFLEIMDRPALLVPGGEVLVNSPPDRVAWTLDNAYSIAWETQAEGVERLRGYDEDNWVASVRRPGTPARTALAACTMGAYRTAEEFAGDAEGFDEGLEAALTATSDAATCASRWDRAWNEGFAPSAQFLERVNDRFQVFTGLNRALRIVVS